MAHIVDFIISELAGRKETYSQELNRDVNVFFGPNGSGKTSLFRILHSAIDRDASMLKTVPFISAEVTIHSIDYDRNFVRTFQKYDTAIKRKVITEWEKEAISAAERIYRPLSLGKEKEELYWSTKPAKAEGAKESFYHIYLPTWRLNVGDRPYSLAMLRETYIEIEREYDWDVFFAKNLEKLWSQFTNKLLREVKEIQEEGLADILRGILMTKIPKRQIKGQDPSIVYGRVAEFLKRQGPIDVLGPQDEFEKRCNEDPKFKKIANDINVIEQRIEKTTDSRNKLEQLIRSMFTGDKSIIFKDSGIEVETKKGKNLSIASLSSGEKHALYVFIETMLAGPSTLLIDEPEISLHVDWQRRLIPAMRQLNPNAQLLLATHSPEIIADIPDHNIFRL